MKILFLIEDITNIGGTERVTITLSKYFNSDNIASEVFSLSGENQNTFYPSDNIPIIYSNKSCRYLALLEAICYARKHKLTILVVSMGRLSVEFAFLARLMMFREFFCYEHVSFGSFGYLIRKLKKYAYNFSKGVILLTEHDVSLVKHEVKQKNIIAIENINPYSHSAYLDRGKKQNIVLAVGRLSFQKNFERLIDIWSKLDSEHWRLVIVGSGPDEVLLQEKINALNCTNIELYGPTNHIEDLYHSAKIVAMTSRYEGFPMVLVEAQSFGAPVVAFDCKTGPAEIIINNESGFVVSYDDDDQFKKKLQSLMIDGQLLNYMSDNAIKNSKRFSYSFIGKKWHSFLEK